MYQTTRPPRLRRALAFGVLAFALTMPLVVAVGFASKLT
jgi:hypothetical protein